MFYIFPKLKQQVKQHEKPCAKLRPKHAKKTGSKTKEREFHLNRTFIYMQFG